MEHVTRTQEIMNLLSLAPEIQEEMSRPRSWAADSGAAAQDILSMSFSTRRLQASFGPLLNQPPFDPFAQRKSEGGGGDLRQGGEPGRQLDLRGGAR